MRFIPFETGRMAREFMRWRCWHCGGVLVAIGHARSNGADHEDWETRILHKKCWRELGGRGELKEKSVECVSGDMGIRKYLCSP